MCLCVCVSPTVHVCVCELFPLFGFFVAHVADVDVACRLSPVAASKDQESRTMTAAVGDTKQNKTKQNKLLHVRTAYARQAVTLCGRK